MASPRTNESAAGRPTHFKVAARTLLHLGAELISSDGIALYELIKNSFDAGAESVEIAVQMAFPLATYQELRGQLLKLPEKREATESQCDQIASRLNDSLPPDIRRELTKKIEDSETVADLTDILDQANCLTVEDTGEGMSVSDLGDVYLTIGTRSRLAQKETSDGSRPILGEKGVGRLSAMRLGDRLSVITAKAGDRRLNVLDIDWRAFSHTEDTLIEEIEVAPRHDGAKSQYFERSGTRIVVSALRSDWTVDKCKRIAIEEISRFLDPFSRVDVEKDRPKLKVFLSFNGEPVSIPRIDRILFKQAHAYVTAKYGKDEDSKPYLSGHIEYRLGKTSDSFRLDKPLLLGLIEDPKRRQLSDYISPTTLNTLGPFEVEFYWFNRRLLESVEGIGTKQDVMALVRRWAGGLMLFRDGFRVNPYGSAEDDWLNLDPKALGAGGYKVNRSQLIGRVLITSRKNPKLVDQTNREGLTNAPEKSLLVVLLQHILIDQFRGYINRIDRELKKREIKPLVEINERMEEEVRRMTHTLTALLAQYPAVKNNKTLVGAFREVQEGIRDLVDDVKKAGDLYEDDKRKLTHLAGIGLMVEFLAHELGRSTETAMNVVRDIRNDEASAERLDLLAEELKTINKRLSILDPMTTTRRQRKTDFDLTELAMEILESHEGQFKRHGIRWEVASIEGGKPPELIVKAVKGMIIQVIENFISNSVYWLKVQRLDNAAFKPKISVHIDAKKERFFFTDNGPGIFEETAEEVFEPFVTYRRPQTGRGLGLYICKEIAEYHDAKIRWSERFRVHKEKLNTLEFSFGAEK